MAKIKARAEAPKGKGQLVFCVLTIIAITFSVYSPSLNNSFTNWDDEAHLTEYLAIRDLNFDNLKKIFSESINKTYIPLTPLSFALEYHFFGPDPFIYHLDNILLHMGVALCVFFLGMRLGLSPFASSIAAIIFSIHPIRVETVAWITERKGLLYACFFLLSLLHYWQYIQSQKKFHYIWSLTWGLLSILSKPMALSLPLILWLLDWWARRPFSKELLLEKIPYFIYIIPITLITYMQHARIPIESIDEGLLIWIWTFIFYLRKFFFPGTVLPIYRLPPPVSLSNHNFALSLLLFLCIIFLLIRFRKNRMVMFSFFFYFLSIFFLLRMDKIYDLNVVADRYMYLPSLGFCLLGGFLSQRLINFTKLKSRILLASGYIFLASVLIYFANYSYNLNFIWKNSLTLWNYIIERNPNEFIAYNNRGIIYAKKGDHARAYQDFDKAIEIHPRYDEAFNNRGNLYKLNKKYTQAIMDYTQAISYNPQYFDAYNNRATALGEQGFYEPALIDLNKAIQINPNYETAYLNRGNIYNLLGQNNRAIEDYNRAIELDPYDPQAYNNRGTSYLKLGMVDLALADFNYALMLDPHNISAQYNKRLIIEEKTD